MAYIIGELSFKTKKACLEYTRQLIRELGCCIIDKNHDKYNFFVGLISNHPNKDEKIGAGIDYFAIENNRLQPNSYHTIIYRIDTTSIDFSWRYCCEFRIKPVHEHLYNAMREAISGEIHSFKQNSILVCNFCKLDTNTLSDYHVDHDDPPFRKLKDDFLTNNILRIPNKFASNEYSFLTRFHDDDTEFKDNWIEFHRNNCKLQILCKSCNLKKH